MSKMQAIACQMFATANKMANAVSQNGEAQASLNANAVSPTGEAQASIFSSEKFRPKHPGLVKFSQQPKIYFLLNL